MINKNLEAIKKTQPDIYKWLISQENQRKEFHLIKANNRDYNLLIKQDSIVFTAYDMDSPRKAARDLAKQFSFYQTHCTIFTGIGCGHLLNLICKKKEKFHKVIIIEPIKDIARIALQCYDFSSYIEDTSIFFARSEEDIAGLIGLGDSSIVLEQWHLITEEYSRKLYADYEQLKNFAARTINQVQCNIGTVMSAGLKLAENDINNLPYVIQHKGVNELKNIYKGKPAVLVSTGPSLTKNIHHLQQYKDKTIIIAVAQALRILLAYDIKPDFICTVDFGEVNLDHLKGLMDIDVPLVCLNRTYAPLIQQWQGPKFIVATPVPGFEHTAVGVLKDKGTIEQGGSVAHMCLGLALHIGCDPIMMIGQDLALSDKSHCNLVDSGGKIEIDNKGEIQWTVDDPGSCLNDQGKKYSMGYAQFVPGYFGDQVLTNIGLASFITSFEAIITKIKQQNESIKNICHKITKTDQILNCSCDPSYQIYNSEIINCTEGGADIKGTNKMSLKKTLSNFDKTIKRKVFKNTIAKDSKKLIKDAMKRINEDLDILEDIIDNSRRGLATCEAMEEAQYEEDKSHFEKLIQANEKYSIAAHDAVKKSALASLAIYKENREINNRDLNIKADIKKLTDEEEVLKTRIKRNRLILRSALDSAKKLKKAYKNCLAKLQKNNKIKERIATAKTLLDKTEQIDSDEYFKVGNWAYPYVMSNDDKIINEAKLMRSHEIINAISSEKKRETDKQLEYIQYIEESRKHGKENVQEALRCINSAIELYPDRFEARWGKATMLVTGQTDESITLYRSLIEDYPDNLQLKFEYCLALMNHNLMDCIKEFDQLMMLTDRFDYFLETIADFFLNLNMYKEAKEIYISYLDKFPLNFNAWKKLAKCYLETKDKDSYESCLKKSKKILEI